MTIWLNILKRKLKGYNVLFLMSIFPIMLTILFVNMFSTITDVEGKAHLSVTLSAEEGTLSQATKGFLEAIDKAQTIDLELVSEEKADFKLEIDEVAAEIAIINQGGGMTEEMTLSSLLETFATEYTMAQVVVGQSQSPLPIEYEKLEGQGVKEIKVPLVITMLIFGIMLGGNFGIGQVFYMKEAVGRRTLTAPISKWTLFLMEYTTSSFIVFIIGLMSMFVYQIIFEINFLHVLGGCIGILLVASLLTTLLGMTIGLYTPNQDMGENILSLIITLSSILSGKLMPMFDLGWVTALSPIKPLVEGLEGLIENGQFTNPLMLISYFVGASLLLACLVGIKFRKEGEVQ